MAITRRNLLNWALPSTVLSLSFSSKLLAKALTDKDIGYKEVQPTLSKSNDDSKIINSKEDVNVEGFLSKDFNSGRYRFITASENLSTVPEKLVYGPGKITLKGKVFESLIPGTDVLHSSVYMTPEDAIHGADFGFPEKGGGNYNWVMSVGSHPEKAITFNRTTAIGTNNFIEPIQIDRCEAFGNSALMFMRYGERNSMFGTIAGQWLGSNDPDGDGHEMWSNAGGYKPGQKGWDYAGFESANPGIGAKIAASTAYARASDECARNVGIGRNVFNGAVKLMNCTGAGYRSLASAYFANNSTAFGADAFRSGLFLNNSVAMGYASGMKWQEGEFNVVIGTRAGINVIKGDGNTLVGALTGSIFKQLNDCIFIGKGSGNYALQLDSAPKNFLAIGNDVEGISSPLISGDMSLPKAGVNILPNRIAGTWHVRSSDAADKVIEPSKGADDLIIENGGNAGITIRSAADFQGALIFSSPTSATSAGIIYNHSTSEMVFRAKHADRWKIAESSFNPISDTEYSIGTAAFRLDYIYTASGLINTSDERLKQNIDVIDEAERRVAVKLKSLIRRYKFSEAVIKKGDKARLHFGIIAQDVIKAFDSEGLNAEHYGILCFDKWDDVLEPIFAKRIVTKKVKGRRRDKDGELLAEEDTEIQVEEEYDTGKKKIVTLAGERYGIRYEELLCFIISSL